MHRLKSLVCVSAIICVVPSFAHAQGAGIEWEILNQEVLDLHQQGQYDRAVKLAHKALEVAEQNAGKNHPDVATTLNNLALLYREQGEYDKAGPLYNRALAINEKALGPDHPNVATSLNNLAGLYHDQGEYEQAEPLYKHALAINEKALGPDHSHVASSLGNLAVLYHTQGEYDKAGPLCNRALAIKEKVHGPDHPEVVSLQKFMALVHKAREERGRTELQRKQDENQSLALPANGSTRLVKKKKPENKPSPVGPTESAPYHLEEKHETRYPIDEIPRNVMRLDLSKPLDGEDYRTRIPMRDFMDPTLWNSDGTFNFQRAADKQTVRENLGSKSEAYRHLVYFGKEMLYPAPAWIARFMGLKKEADWLTEQHRLPEEVMAEFDKDSVEGKTFRSAVVVGVWPLIFFVALWIMFKICVSVSTVKEQTRQQPQG